MGQEDLDAFLSKNGYTLAAWADAELGPKPLRLLWQLKLPSLLARLNVPRDDSATELGKENLAIRTDAGAKKIVYRVTRS